MEKRGQVVLATIPLPSDKDALGQVQAIKSFYGTSPGRS